MTTPSSGLIEVTLSGTFLGRPWANVFHYWNQDAGGVVQKAALATSFNAQVANRLPLLSSDKVFYDNIKIRDMIGITPDYEQAPSQPTGQVGGDALPAFNTYRYLYSVTDKTTRKGWKRYPGVVEANQADGSLTAAAFSAHQAEELSFLQPITNTTQSYLPVIFGGPTLGNPTRFVINIVNGISAQQKLGSQVSRR